MIGAFFTFVAVSVLLMSILLQYVHYKSTKVKTFSDYMSDFVEKDNIFGAIWLVVNGILSTTYIIVAVCENPGETIPLILFAPLFYLVNKVGCVKSKVKKFLVEFLKEDDEL